MDPKALQNSLYGQYLKLCVKAEWDPVDIKDFDRKEMKRVTKEFKEVTCKQEHRPIQYGYNRRRYRY